MGRIRVRDKEKRVAHDIKYREANRAKIFERQMAYEARNPEKTMIKHRKFNIKWRAVLKIAAFNAYGGPVCACCGETEIMFLSMDHMNDNGADHRRQIGRTSLYQWLKNNGYPEGFQVLCLNCNRGRYLNGGICPHKTNTTGAKP